MKYIHTIGALAVVLIIMSSPVHGTNTYVGVQWVIQVLLRSANNYVYDISTTVVNSWSDVLTYEEKYNQQNTQCELCNGTIIANITGKIGKYSYSSSIVTSAIAAYAKVNSQDQYINTLNSGTGLAPISCVSNASTDVSSLGDLYCNILASSAALLTPVNDSYNTINFVYETGNNSKDNYTKIVSPLTLAQLAKDSKKYKKLVRINDSETGVNVEDGNGITDISLAAYIISDDRVIESKQCYDASIMMGSIESQIVGGDRIHCMSWGDTTLVAAWDALASFNSLNRTDCSTTTNNSVTILFPGQYDTDGTNPFAYAVVTQNGFIKCTYGMYQSNDPEANNNNWAILYAFNTPLNGDLSSCVDSLHWNTTTKGMRYMMILENIQNTTMYIHQDTQSLDSLQTNGTSITPNNDGGICLWEQVLPSPGTAGDGSKNFAGGVIPTAVSLMYTSGRGINHETDVASCINGIQNDIGSFTIFNALSTGMTAVAAGIGVNAFRISLKILDPSKMSIKIIRFLISIIEAASVNIATIVYMVSLANRGKSTHTVSWYDESMNNEADYTKYNLYVGTEVTIVGKADYYNMQWVLLALAITISTTLVMWRWHFANEYSTWGTAKTPSQSLLRGSVTRA